MLWNEEFERLRPQLRAEADSMLAEFDTGIAPDLPLDEWVAALREREIGGPVSDHGVDRTIPGPAGPMRLRTFTPETIDAVMLHIHGGGFVAGAPETTDVLHEIVGAELNLAVVSVDYRLAPEHPYPAGPDDCQAAAAWLLENAEAEFGTDHLLIGGESVGAHLSACTLLRVRDRLGAIDRFHGANLVCGVYDLSRTPSQRGVDEQPDMLSIAGLLRHWDCFTPGMSPEARRDPDISPLYASLHGMPPAQFVVGAADHLVDDSLLLASRWQLAGNRAELLVYPEGPHACLAMPTVAAHWFPRFIEFLRGCIKQGR